MTMGVIKDEMETEQRCDPKIKEMEVVGSGHSDTEQPDTSTVSDDSVVVHTELSHTGVVTAQEWKEGMDEHKQEM